MLREGGRPQSSDLPVIIVVEPGATHCFLGAFGSRVRITPAGALRAAMHDDARPTQGTPPAVHKVWITANDEMGII